MQIALDIFQDWANAASGVIGGTAETAGYLLGFGVVISVAVASMILVITLGGKGGSAAIVIGLFLTLASIVFVAQVGWWPWWSVILLFIFAGVLAVRVVRGQLSGSGASE